MKTQTTLLLSVLFALLIAVFAVVNVAPVRVNYILGESEWPLVLVILTSVFLGGLVTFFVGMFRIIGLRRQNHVLIHQVEELRKELHENKHEKGSGDLKKIAPDSAGE